VPINYLRLFRAAASLFQAARDQGTTKPIGVSAFVAAHDELMTTVFQRNLSYKDNMNGIIASSKSEQEADAMFNVAEGIVATVSSEHERSQSIYQVGYGLNQLWATLDDVTKDAIRHVAEQSLAVWSELDFVKALQESATVPSGRLMWYCLEPPADPAKREAGDKLIYQSEVGQTKDALALDETFARWAEGQLHRLKIPTPDDEIDTPVDPSLVEATVAQPVGTPTTGQRAGNDAGPGETPGSSSNPHRTGPRWREWAIGLELADKWHLFRQVKGEWRPVSVVRGISKGRQANLMRAFADGGGFLSKADALRLERSIYSVSDTDKLMGRITPELTKVRNAIRAAVGVKNNKADPLPFDDNLQGWQAQIAIGYAVQDDRDWVGGARRLRFKTREQLTADESADR
jgi:hypothetical protein